MDVEKGKHNSEEDRGLLEELEDEEGLPYELTIEEPPHPPSPYNWRLWGCIAVNCVSTVAIVFVNKSIFSVPPPSLKKAQVSFAAFHFLVTALTLFALSRPSIGVFQAKRVDVFQIMPLSMAMILNVVLQNAALANSSIQFNQVARVLLTPTCALLNFIMYRQKLSFQATLTLIPICAGVALVSYFDTNTSALASAHDTTPIGVMFALAGVCASAVYTVWVKPFHEKLGCDTWQLLLNQAAVSVGLMLYVIPFTDDRRVWFQMEVSTWIKVVLSGFLAVFINVSMFVIIKDAGAVSSTVVGHLKTCTIILLGWLTSQRAFKLSSASGFALAIGGIIAYSIITHRQSQK